jgi:general secretion pathway protein E
MVAQLETFAVGDCHPAREALARRLLDCGKLTQPGLDRARRLAEGGGDRLERVLAQLGLVSERDIAETLAAILELPMACAGDYPQAPVLEDQLRPKFLKEARILPLADRATDLVVAMVDPLNEYAASAAAFAADKPVLRFVAYPADFEAAYDRLYGTGRSEIHDISEETRARVDAGA